ncbi:keratin, type I cytoskeletal 9-like [Impatiens glandulifera]|uniref:keratin, type I cytoskeletal 9-like n=1 Tax=Impatiens glandulifera TaxID=253017 RepID=UPI001FB10D8F|nr:keratin, type I cytoskeletal 9-like [Impatiens glandulifera]
MAVMESNMMKIMKNQTSNKKEFADLLKTHNEMEQTLKKNTYEVRIVNKSYSKFEKNFFKRQSELLDCKKENNVEMHNEVMDGISLIRDQMVEIQGNIRRADAERLEQADSFARNIQDEKDVKAAAEKEKNFITQGEDNNGRRGGGVSTGTRSKRNSTGDNSDRPIKKGGGRSGDRGGRSIGGRNGDLGGRSGGTGRGGHSLPHFHKLLTSEEISGQGFTYPIDPLSKREEQ